MGIVQIRVWVDDTGHALAANVYGSSGWESLDEAALGAAASAIYSPAFYNRRPIGSTDIFRVEFAEGH